MPIFASDAISSTAYATDEILGNEEEQDRMQKVWAKYGFDDALEILYSPYRELSGPVLRYIDQIDARWDNDTITVVIPEFVVQRWWEHLLHNQTALFLKARLLFRKGTVVTSIPYHVERTDSAGEARR